MWTNIVKVIGCVVSQVVCINVETQTNLDINSESLHKSVFSLQTWSNWLEHFTIEVIHIGVRWWLLNMQANFQHKLMRLWMVMHLSN